MGFESFLGNPAAVLTLRDLLRREALSGSFLFSGPDGVGKKSLAFMLAKALNCERLHGDFCGNCSHCVKTEEMLLRAREDLARRREMKDATRRVEGLIYFDVQFIEPITRFILIEQIRQLRSAAYARAFEFQRRVFILNQAQTVHWQAVDLLLKVMEEPPEGATLVLICPNAYELRPTLRSRCRRIQFRPVEDGVIRQVLQNQKRIQAAQLDLATRWAAGSIAAAIEFDLASFQASRQPWIDFIGALAGKDWRSASAGEWKALFDATKALAENRERLEERLKTGYTLLSDLVQIIETGDTARVVNVDLLPRLRQWADRLGLDGVERLKHGLDEAYRLQTRNVNLQLGWEALALDSA